MIKWDVIFSAESFYYWYHAPKKTDANRKTITTFQNRIEQHNIILSSSLRDEYDDYFYEHAEIEEIEDMENLLSEKVSYAPEGEDSVSFRYVLGTEGTNIEDKIINTSNSRQLEHPIIVCDNTEQTRRIKKVKPEQIVVERKNVLENRLGNRILRNSGPLTIDLYPREIGEYKEWIKECFYHEKIIDIFDPYLLTDSGLSTFLKYYIRNIEKGANINIYVQRGKGEPRNETLMKNLEFVVKQYKFVLDIYVVSEWDDFHERRIFLNTSRHRVCIGHGIDNIKFRKSAVNNNETLRDCELSINDDVSFKEELLNRYKFTLEISMPSKKTAGSES